MPDYGLASLVSDAFRDVPFAVALNELIELLLCEVHRVRGKPDTLDLTCPRHAMQGCAAETEASSGLGGS